jgi:hypothetical protein
MPETHPSAVGFARLHFGTATKRIISVQHVYHFILFALDNRMSDSIQVEFRVQHCRPQRKEYEEIGQ